MKGWDGGGRRIAQEECDEKRQEGPEKTGTKGIGTEDGRS